MEKDPHKYLINYRGPKVQPKQDVKGVKQVSGAANSQNSNSNLSSNNNAGNNVSSTTGPNVKVQPVQARQYTAAGPSAATPPVINTHSTSNDNDDLMYDKMANAGSDFGLDDELSNTSLEPGAPQPGPSPAQSKPSNAQAEGRDSKSSEKQKDSSKPKKEGFVRKIASKLKKK